MYPQVFGKYVLERELARGGMARVVLATLRGAGGFEKKLVVKQIRDELASDDEFVRRFVDEAKTTVALAHPNIVPVYELGIELGTYFLAMEYVEGASLAEILRAAEGGRLSPEEGAYVGVEVCRALDYAHRRMNVVHRDVTPRNVMVDEEGQVKVIDFGISAPVATAPSGHGVFGSPGHMPPEQMDGRELTPAADVFAVAVLLMELWSGKPPFRRHTAVAIDEALQGRHPLPSEFDPGLSPLDDVLARAMALDPRQRPQQADDLARALRRFLSGADLGDVERKLGERVRRVRESPPPPPTQRKPILQRPPSRPSATDLGTKTFAVREEVGAWEPGPGTRRIATDPPPASRPPEIETIATRPIETPARDTRPATPASPRRRVAGLGLVAAVAVSVGAFFLGRGAAERSSSSVTAPAVPLAPPRAESAAPALSPPPSSPSSVPAPSLAPPPPSPSPAAPSPERATLTLVGDGTTVQVDGVGRGQAPLRLAVDPGQHAVVFRFAATGEAKAATFSVRSGERATLRADFTGATPSVRVER